MAKVLSTTTIAPASCAASAAARMSTMFSSGFVGVSSQTIRVRSSRWSRSDSLIVSAESHSNVYPLGS